jgi:(1->4)-alpha-D-glucan 1-alpha-D-glucosylmutase
VKTLPAPPTSTYRLQFHAGFTFEDARCLVPYLHSLGVSHIYASPYLRARTGSMHGYDVADPNSLNPELGSQTDYDNLVAELQRHGMGQLADVVPNHMGIGDPGNFRWLDVLENGPASIYATFFDINWRPAVQDERRRSELKLIVPILGDQYGKVLENGELKAGYANGAFGIAYYDRTFPIAPDSYPMLLEAARERMEEELGRRHEHVQELASILTALRNLPPRRMLDAAAIEERNREKEIVKRRINALHAASQPFRTALEAVLVEANGRPGEPSSFDRLDVLLDEQSYRLAFWRVAAEEINYRRFFDISELAAVRMEDPTVFKDTHRLLLRLVAEGKIQGLRIDHPDGLRDPAGYLRHLQRVITRESTPVLEADPSQPHSRAPRTQDDTSAQDANWPVDDTHTPVATRAHDHVGGEAGADMTRPLGGGSSSPHGAGESERSEARWSATVGRDHAPRGEGFYIVVEKILEASEKLRPDWPVSGTTGYDFLNVLNGIFVARQNEQFLSTIYFRFLRQGAQRFADLANSTRKMVMLISLASEVNELGYLLRDIATSGRRYRDFTLNSLTFVIREVIAALGIYRTYIDPETGAASDSDRRAIEHAVAEAKRRNPRTDPSIFDFVGDTLLLRVPGQVQGDRKALNFIARFQQTTGPVMAKGTEDTAFYVYNRLISLNEVGGDPDQFGRSLTAFHRYNAERARDWPATLLATSTHDSKRSEDVRARIDVLSELPRDWRAALTRWTRLNGRKKLSVQGRVVPDRNEEYLLYQTLLGAWPAGTVDEVLSTADASEPEFVRRICEFTLKALKEAKVHTSWITPNVEYEDAMLQFVRAILDPTDRPFLEDFVQLQKKVAFFGVFNALSQTVLKLGSPGVADVYQGNELWDFSLVDPDNRRAVDYDLRRVYLQELVERIDDPLTLVPELLDAPEDGRIKLYISQRLLCLRRERPELFVGGSYTPLRGNQHVAAFARGADGQTLVIAAPVQLATLTRGAQLAPIGPDVWREAWLALPGEPGRVYRDLFTGHHHTTRPHAGRAALKLAELFGHFPVAVLLSE